MADDDTDVQSNEITPEDLMADEQESPKTEPSTVKEEKPAKVEAKEEAKAEPEAKEETESEEPEAKEAPKEPAEEKPAEETEPEPPKGKAEDRKTQLNTEIRDLVAQRNALKEQVEKANSEVYQPATEDELTEQGMTSLEAKVEAMRQTQEMEKYNSQVADAQLTISSEADRVLQDFPIFNSESDQFDKELAEEAAQLLDANLIKDPNSGQIIGSNVSPYQLYKTLARASGISAVKGQMKGQKETEQMLANADSGASATVPKKVVDPIIDLWTSDD